MTCMFLKSNQEEVQPIALIEDENIVGEYVIDCEKERLSTKNITNYFDKQIIQKIIPYINPIYQEKLKDIEYEINNQNFDTSIQKLTVDYLNKIKEYSITDYNTMYINGIKVKQVQIQVSTQQLKDIIKKYPNLTYTTKKTIP